MAKFELTLVVNLEPIEAETAEEAVQKAHDWALSQVKVADASVVLVTTSLLKEVH